MRKVFLDDLPRWEIGTNRGKINWKESASRRARVAFVYDDTEGEVEIIDYNSKDFEITIRYINEYYKIKTNTFTRGKIGIAIGKFNRFKFSIGENLKSEKKDINILDRKYVKNKYNKKIKYYKCKCNICGFNGGEHYKSGKYCKDLWTIESSVYNKNIGCPCCDGKIAVFGINDITTTDGDVVKFFLKGYEEAKKYTRMSGFKVDVICPICDTPSNKTVAISRICLEKSITCICNDEVSYSEKFLYCLLKELNVEFKTQLTNATFEWCGRYRYDFYIPSFQCIIETHGEQHYCRGFRTPKGRTVEEEQENDRIKKELAIENNIAIYIVLDCRKSEYKWIKNNILSSNISKLFDLTNIDWLKCDKFAHNSLLKRACDYKRENPNSTISEIADILGFSSCTVRRWLKKGSAIGLCDYNSQEELHKSNKRNSELRSKEVEIFKDGYSLGKFQSTLKLEGESLELFGVKLSHSSISKVCLGKAKSHKGYTFKYVD